MPSSSLLKTSLNKSIADGIYNEIMSRYSRYYYFLGRTLTWEEELAPPYPTDSFAYELNTRDEIITLKEVKPTDVSYVIPRHDWASGTVYDPYDDQYCTEVQGLNLISGGLSYATAPNVYIGSQGAVAWDASTAYVSGQMISHSGRYYIVTNTGVTSATTGPVHTTGSALNGTATLQWVEVNNASGSGATAVSTVLDGQVIDITLTHRGTGYRSIPSVIIAGSSGANAMAEAVVTIAPSGAQKLEDCIFYVVTDEYNVYKCLDNNLNAQSTLKPTGTTVDPVVMADGYMWKFMYNIPIALRNKFLTDQYMPVVTALRNQFYSNGNLQTIRIDKAGSGYTSGSIVVAGDGYSEANPLYLQNYTVANVGSGYTEPVTVTVAPPISGPATWNPNALVLVGQIIQSGQNVYRVAISGTTSTVAPVHRFSTVSNGTSALQYVGTIPTADVTLDMDGAIDTIVFYGMLNRISMVGGGSGYTSVPTVNITGGNGSSATAAAVLVNGSVIRVVVNDPGFDFTSDPTITFGTQWTSGAAATIGQQIWYSNRLYTVITNGNLGTVAPVHSTGDDHLTTTGTAYLQYAGVPATATASIKYGSGYSDYPTVTITGGDLGADANVYFTGVKSEATLIPIFDEGALVGVQIDDGGVGYSYSNLTVLGDGTDAEITADLSPGDVNTLQSNIELLTPDGRIMGIPLISGGFGYGNATITITGDGSGASAVAVLENGSIKKINMTSYGSGYRWANITITGTGFGAKARAVMAPFGGHGKNALTNMFTRYLMFYSNMSQDKNQGFDVNNDFRQLGIIKAPRKYGSTASYTSTSGSACWVVSGNANTTLFPSDAELTKVDDSSRFRIVTNNGSALLLQSLDNSVATVGSVFVNNNGDLFTCSAATAPTVDKYSGDLLFIDNRAAFTPTADQTVTMRTVLKF